MNYELKSMINSMINFGDALEDVSDFGELSVKQVLRHDILKYLLYLSASDGVVDEAEAEFIKDYLDLDMTPTLWKKFIQENNIYSTDFESKIPVGLTIFLKADNNAVRNDSNVPNICDLYIGTFETIGNILIQIDGDIDDQEVEDLDIYLSLLKEYVEENSLRNNRSSYSRITKNGSTNSVVKGVQNTSAKFLICPNCGKMIPNKGTYCGECYEDFDDMIFTDRNYKSPISETKYYDICSSDKKEYKKICFVTQSSGIIYSPFEKDGEYTEDYFEDSFTIKGGKIVTEEEIYEKYGDYLYEPQTQYVGTIPDGNYFEAHCRFNEYVRPIWFHANGTVVGYDGFGADAKVSHEGRYIREGDLIRTDMTEKKTGKKTTYIWLVINGALCRDAYVNDNGFAKVTALRSKPMPTTGGSLFGTTITKEEFFENYPCQWCNARQTFIEQSWDYTSFGCISVSGRCRKCNGFFTECKEPEIIKKIAYNGSPRNPYYKPTAGATRYLDNSCPYCGSYQVRYAKWEDKQMSAAFWGFFSQKLHAHYKCEKCGKMWE